MLLINVMRSVWIVVGYFVYGMAINALFFKVKVCRVPPGITRPAKAVSVKTDNVCRALDCLISTHARMMDLSWRLASVDAVHRSWIAIKMAAQIVLTTVLRTQRSRHRALVVVG